MPEVGSLLTNNVGVLGTSATWTIIAVMILFFVVALVLILMNELKYNVYTDVWESIGSNYKLNRVKGGIFKDKDGVRTFKTKKFGKNGKRVNYREPNNELFADFENYLFNVPFFPKVQNEQIAFLNPFGETFIPVRRSFISLKRGVDLRVTSKEDCEFCQTGVDMTQFLDDPKKYLAKIKEMDHICEKHLTELVNARYECIDQSDLSWMWKQIDDIKNEFGTFMMKYAPLIAAAGILVFVAFVVLITYKLQPDIAEVVAQHNRAYIEALKLKNYEVANNVTIPTN